MNMENLFPLFLYFFIKGKAFVHENCFNAIIINDLK